jgi:hypothetical protein
MSVITQQKEAPFFPKYLEKATVFSRAWYRMAGSLTNCPFMQGNTAYYPKPLPVRR